jgi:hypothetical protein
VVWPVHTAGRSYVGTRWFVLRQCHWLCGATGGEHTECDHGERHCRAACSLGSAGGWHRAVILREAAGVGERNLSVKTRVRYLAAVPLTAANAVAWYAVSEALQPFPVACSVGQMLGRSYRGARWTQARAGWDSELAEALGAGAAPNFRGGLPARSTLLHVATANGHVSTPCACAACMAVELTAAWRRSAACESCCVMSTTNIAMRWT